MRTAIFLCFFLVVSLGLQAQVKTPKPSPDAKVEQTVGLTDVAITYCRPSIKGRVIYGDLVPFDRLWRTGANANTKVTFSTDVTIKGQKLKKGTYAIFTKPMKALWEVYFYTDTDNWGLPRNWDASKVAATIKVEPQMLPFTVESFTINVDNLTMNGAEIGIYWEKTKITIPLEVPTDAITSKSIDMVMNGPSANDYFSSGLYYLQAGKDLNKAKMWLEKATKLRPNAYWYSRQLSLVNAKLGDKKAAIKVAKKSLMDAEKAGNSSYIKMNKKSLSEWGAK